MASVPSPSLLLEASKLDHLVKVRWQNVPSVLDWVLEASPPVALCGDEIVTPSGGPLASPWPPGLLKS